MQFDELNDSFDVKLLGDNDKDDNVSLIHVTEDFNDEIDSKSPILSLNTTDAEKQTHSTDLELSLRSPGLQSSILCEYYINTPNYKDVPNKVKELQNVTNSFEANIVVHNSERGTLSLCNKTEPLATYCFSTYNVPHKIDQSPMRKSKKSTNLVKYRNMSSEPPLKKPFNTYMLLGNYSNKITKDSLTTSKNDQSVVCNIVSQKHMEIQAEVAHNTKAFKENVTTSDLDRITEKLMTCIFEKIENSSASKNVNVKTCINQVVKELYDSKITHKDAHPVIALFKCLLEYWLKNTSLECVREAVRRVKAIDRQSNQHFTKDQNTSSFCIGNVNKHTQFHGISDIVNTDISRILVGIMNKKGTSNRSRSPEINDSSEKERRIQELERILKNTVYICETARSKSIEKDIKMTKTLIDNLEKMSQKTVHGKSDDNSNVDTSNSSSELPKIQDTINRLISETSLPLDIAKDFLSAYLDLLHDSKTSNSSSESSDNSKIDSGPECDVQTESIQKKASIGITTREHIDRDTAKHDKQEIDPGQLYLKSIIDNITAIFCNGNKEVKDKDKKHNTKADDTDYTTDELEKVTHKNSMVIDLSNYNLEHVSMISNPNVKEITSITIKLKEKFVNPKETKSSHLQLKFSDNPKTLNEKRSDWIPLSPNNPNSNKYFCGKTDEKSSIAYDFDMCKDFDLKPYLTDSDATSKDYRLVNSDHSLNLGFQNNAFRDLSDSTKSLNEEHDTCYIFSSLKKCPFQKKKNQSNDAIDNKDIPAATTTNDFTDEVSMFERAPKVIDERFLLLLLENLTYLSKNVPTIHKDINALYLRLRKKYDKILKNDPNANPHGVGLLGKIYNDENNKSMNDNETQFEKSICCESQKEIATNTSDVSISCDKSLTTNMLVDQVDTDIQTDQCNCKKCLEYKGESRNSFKPIYNTSTTQTPTFSNTSEREPISITAEKAISNQNWYRRICTKDCGVTTLLKYVLDGHSSSQNFRIKPRHVENKLALKLDKELSTMKSLRSDRGHSTKIRQDLLKEITLLSPCFKVSTQSQTEEQNKPNLGKDFDVYELYQSKILKRSSSMIELNGEIREKSDDLKTLYRCTSDPSYCSG
ncbi:uncharacterized protein [Epargyreus clarus]|uniref:uncharacterized protein n=1 Tax=Epargyreus clarus TaxID=520877 RepID=UPI003C2D9114